MKKIIIILVFIMFGGLAVYGYVLFERGDLNFAQVNILGIGENVNMDADTDIDDNVDYDVTLKKFSYDSSQDDNLRFRVKFPEDGDYVLVFVITNEKGEVVNSTRYSKIHVYPGETSPADIILPIEWSESGTYGVAVTIADRVNGSVVYGDEMTFYYQ